MSIFFEASTYDLHQGPPCYRSFGQLGGGTEGSTGSNALKTNVFVLQIQNRPEALQHDLVPAKAPAPWPRFLFARG